MPFPSPRMNEKGLTIARPVYGTQKQVMPTKYLSLARQVLLSIRDQGGQLTSDEDKFENASETDAD